MAYRVGGSGDSWRKVGRQTLGTLFLRTLPPIILVAIMWVVFAFEIVIGPRMFYSLGVTAGDLSRPWTWITANFIHVNLDHILGNTFFLLVLGILVSMEGWRRWLIVTVSSMLGLGLFATFVTQSGVTGGASGIVFGYFGYLLAAVIAERTLWQKVLRVIVAIFLLSSYWYVIISGFIPQGSMSWQGHLGGFLFGVLAAFYCERREWQRIIQHKPRSGPPDPYGRSGPSDRGPQPPAPRNQRYYW